MCGLLNDNLNVIREALTNALTDLTQPFDSYTPEQKEQKRAEYIAALHALDDAAGWEMLPDGEYGEGDTITVDNDGGFVTIHSAYGVGVRKATAMLPLSADIRLFRKRQPAQGA